LNEIFSKIRQNRYFPYILAFLAGCIFTGLLFTGLRPAVSGKLDKRYASQNGRTTEIVRQFEQERELNRQLRDHNNRAKDLTEGLAISATSNVRNLQDAVSLIGEIRAELKVLAYFYDNSGTVVRAVMK
jgi:hypothetical protein